MGTIRVLSPVAESKVSQTRPVPLPAELATKTIGFLDNTNANFALLARHMETLLREGHAVAAALHRKKPNLATPAPPEMLAALQAADLVITGSAD